MDNDTLLGKVEEMLGLSYNGSASHPGGSSNTPSYFLYRYQDQLSPNGPQALL